MGVREGHQRGGGKGSACSAGQGCPSSPGPSSLAASGPRGNQSCGASVVTSHSQACTHAGIHACACRCCIHGTLASNTTPNIENPKSGLININHTHPETTNPQSEQQACQSKLGWHMFNSWTSQLPTTLSRRHIPWHHFQILLRQATLVLVSGYACASQLSCEAHECKPETCCDSDAF